MVGVIAGKYPLNLCPSCLGELKTNKKHPAMWICCNCGEKWSKSMLNVTNTNIEDYSPCDKKIYHLCDEDGSHIITVLCYEPELYTIMEKYGAAGIIDQSPNTQIPTKMT